jgi:geranylgeranyl diphosphate synthase type II
MSVSAEGIRWSALRADIESHLKAYLPPRERLSEPLWEAMAHSLLAGGKRLRPLLVYGAWEAAGGAATEDLWRTCAAAEYLHTFSLVHDDLPCMDDDDLRRGQPTCHKRFGEGLAVLAGDALAALAFEVLAGTSHPELVGEFARAIGGEGMIGGQVADLQAEGRPADRELVTRIHRLKTAALMRACVRAGGILARADRATLEALSEYGEALGLAFQIKDDLLDVLGSTALLGKTAGLDARRAKATYPAATSLAEAQRQCDLQAARALTALGQLEGADLLRELVQLGTRREV